MYMWYNNVLRYTSAAGLPPSVITEWAPSFVKKWKEEGWRGVFTTTIHGEAPRA